MPALHLESALGPGGVVEGLALDLAPDGTIASVETRAPRTDDVRLSGFALPGLPNLHSHAFQRGFAGLTERAGQDEDSFWTWRASMYRFLDRMTADDVEAIAGLLYAEMLEAGFTTVGEFHYLHHDVDGRRHANIAEMAERIAAAADATGIGLTLLPVFYAHGGFGGAPAVHGQRRFLNDLDGFVRLHDASARALARLPHARIGIAPHSLRAVTTEELSALLAAHPTGPVHIHVAEQVKEVEDCLAAHGRRPIERLYDIAPVDARWCLIHATHADASERAAIAASGAVVGFCPVTEANLGDGIFAMPDFATAGGRFGVGTDSNVSISAADELRTLEYVQRLSTRRRNALSPRGASTGRWLHEQALAGGARALALPGAGFTPGARADVVLLDTDHVALAGRAGESIVDTFVFAGGAAAIREVWSAGRKVVADGRHVARDGLEPRFRATMERLAAG